MGCVGGVIVVVEVLLVVRGGAVVVAGDSWFVAVGRLEGWLAALMTVR